MFRMSSQYQIIGSTHHYKSVACGHQEMYDLFLTFLGTFEPAGLLSII